MKNKSIREKILIVDDSEINRELLIDMLESEYEILEAEDGEQALSVIEENANDLSLVLLDMVMPKLDGIGVLRKMNVNGWIERIPVIMISVQNESSFVETAFSLGASDFILRPFDALIVHRRVVNTILLYSKQKKLIDLAADQVYEKEKQSRLMIEILSNIVEFRNGESGRHVRNVRTITSLFLKKLNQMEKYQFDYSEISAISLASSLHDIGKIAIPDDILYKPGRLTKEEFETVKKHSEIGEKIINDLNIENEALFVKYARQICRWHHERYDGSGYPDKLKGDQIPIAAQVVALADVYDALTSDRVYKKAIPHSQAVEMILNGECGVFNPDLMRCLNEIQGTLETIFENEEGMIADNNARVHDEIERILKSQEYDETKNQIELKNSEKIRNDFLASFTNEIQFDYRLSPSVVSISRFGAKMLGLDETIVNPNGDEKVLKRFGIENLKGIKEAVAKTTPDDPETTFECIMEIGGENRWIRAYLRSIWSAGDKPEIIEVIGKTVDIHREKTRLQTLDRMASTDALTGLYNRAAAETLISKRLERNSDTNYAMFLFDLDRFKEANDEHGHMFGDRVLVDTSKKLRQVLRSTDICARIGGDEFLIFIEYNSNIEQIVERIFRNLNSRPFDEGYMISISMGVSVTQKAGRDYDDLLVCADKALYHIKRIGGGRYCFYDNSMSSIFSTITPIDGE